MTAPATLECCARLLLGCFLLFPCLSAQAPSATSLRAWRDGMLAPVRVAVDPGGRVYCADASLGSVSVRDEFGRLLGGRTGFDRPLGVAVDAQGRIYVAEEGAGSVSVFASDWTRLGQLGSGSGEFLQPNHVAVAADGEVYVTDSGAHKVKVYGSDGALHRTFGGFGTANGQFDFPTGIAVSARGEVFVADQNNDRMQVLDRYGDWQRTLGKGGMLGSKLGRIQGLLLDAKGRLLVADAFKGIVHVLDPASGVFLGTIGAFGEGPGQLAGPSSLAIDRNNRLFVASPGSSRVDLFGLDNYSDPTVLQATARILPPVLLREPPVRGRRGLVRHVAVAVSVPGFGADQIVPASVTLNGFPALDPPVPAIKVFQPGDTPMLVLAYALQPLLEGLPDGQVSLILRGQLAGGLPFETTALVTVQANGDAE